MNNRHNTTSLVMVILILTPFLLLSCGGESVVEETETQVEKQDSFQSYQLDLKGESIPFADLIDNIEITRLEETGESLLGYVRELYFHEGKMIFPSGNEGNVYVFSDKGEFIRKINRRGEGPEEYGNWNDIWVKDGLIGVYTHQRHIKQYDIEGNFVSADRMLQGATHLHPYKDGYALDMNFNMTSDTLKYALTILDGEMNVDKTYLPFDKFPGFGLSTNNRTVFPVGDDVFFLQLTSDMVYKIDADSLRPYIHYDFGDDWYFQPGVKFDQSVMSESGKNGQVWFMNNRIGQNHIFLSAVEGNAGHYFFIDRKSKKATRIDDQMSADEEFGISSIGWDGDEFLFMLQSTHLSALLEQLDESQYSNTAGTTLDEVESSENPVLIRMKLKQTEDWNK